MTTLDAPTSIHPSPKTAGAAAPIEHEAPSESIDFAYAPQGRLAGKHLLLAATLALVGIIATFPAWAEIFVDYAYGDFDEYSHIYFVPLIAAFLVYVRRQRFRYCRAGGFLLGPAIVAVGWFVHWWGFNNSTQAMFHLGAVMVPVGAATAALGKNALLRFLPAVIVLLFVIPLPGQIRQEIAIPLQNWTANISHVILGLLGQSSELSGNTVIINGEPVMVAEACNGMRNVPMLMLIGFAFCFGMPLRNGVRIAILLLCPAVVLLCNVLRTVPTIWLYGEYGNQHVVPDQFHSIAGWMLLPLTALILYGILVVLRWTGAPVERFRLASRSY
ncbi:MAG: exosortase/archaeosortase family protein [Planctomycetota bacterium]